MSIDIYNNNKINSKNQNNCVYTCTIIIRKINVKLEKLKVQGMMTKFKIYFV